MKGEKIPCIPSLVPVVQLAQPGKLLGRMVERKGAYDPSFINRERIGNLPSFAIGEMMSKVAPSNPMIAVFMAGTSIDYGAVSARAGIVRPLPRERRFPLNPEQKVLRQLFLGGRDEASPLAD